MLLSRPRILLIAKSLLALALLCAVLFILSIKLTLGLSLGEYRALTVSAGAVGFINAEVPFDRPQIAAAHVGPFFIDRNDAPLEWWCVSTIAGEYALHAFPLWIPIAATLIPGAILFARFRNIPGHCTFCRYNLTGLPPNSSCPECGRRG